MTFKKSAEMAGLESEPGKQAIKREYRDQIDTGKSVALRGSLDMDKHFQNLEPSANRWDYAVGFKSTSHFVIWVEAHAANSSHEIDAVLKKLLWLKSKLKTKNFSYLNKLTNRAGQLNFRPYRWIYSGKMSFRSGGKEEKRLAQAGMRLPERKLQIG